MQVDSEEAVNGAAENAWFYNAYAARLIVKVVAVESGPAHESRTPSIDVTPFSLLARSRQAR